MSSNESGILPLNDTEEDEFSKTLNELFGTEINWSDLSTADRERLLSSIGENYKAIAVRIVKLGISDKIKILRVQASELIDGKLDETQSSLRDKVKDTIKGS